MSMLALSRLDELAVRQPWMRDAACLGHDPELFFASVGHEETVAAAKAVCADCPVRTDCLDYALTNYEQHGVWGGTSLKQRAAMRRERTTR